MSKIVESDRNKEIIEQSRDEFTPTLQKSLLTQISGKFRTQCSRIFEHKVPYSNQIFQLASKRTCFKLRMLTASSMRAPTTHDWPNSLI